jgi:hypothetical protein
MFGATAAQILIRMFGDSNSFNITSDTLKTTRFYTSFLAAAFEEAQSRVYGGSHFNTSCMVGLQCGKLVGDWSYDNCFTLAYSPATSSPGGNNNVVGLAIGITSLVLFGIAVIIIIACVLWRRRKQRRNSPFVLEEIESSSNNDLK